MPESQTPPPSSAMFPLLRPDVLVSDNRDVGLTTVQLTLDGRVILDLDAEGEDAVAALKDIPGHMMDVYARGLLAGRLASLWEVERFRETNPNEAFDATVKAVGRVALPLYRRCLAILIDPAVMPVGQEAVDMLWKAVLRQVSVEDRK